MRQPPRTELQKTFRRLQRKLERETVARWEAGKDAGQAELSALLEHTNRSLGQVGRQQIAALRRKHQAWLNALPQALGGRGT